MCQSLSQFISSFINSTRIFNKNYFCCSIFTTRSISSQNELINRELKYGAHNYKPLPVVISKAQGIFTLL